MNLNQRFIFNLILFLITFVSSWFLLTQGAHLPTGISASPDKPDLFMKTVLATQLNATGTREYSIHANDLNHFQEVPTTSQHLVTIAKQCFQTSTGPTDFASFLNPIVYLYGHNKNPTVITADKGTSLNENTAIIFNQNVTGRLPTNNMTLSTDQLIACPQAKFIYTDQAVHLDQPSGDAQSIGASFDTNTNQVQLKSRAEGEYDPNQ